MTPCRCCSKLPYSRLASAAVILMSYLTGIPSNDAIRTQIVRMYADFVSEVDPKGGIMDWLLQEEVVTFEMKVVFYVFLHVRNAFLRFPPTGMSKRRQQKFSSQFFQISSQLNTEFCHLLAVVCFVATVNQLFVALNSL